MFWKIFSGTSGQCDWWTTQWPASLCATGGGGQRPTEKLAPPSLLEMSKCSKWEIVEIYIFKSIINHSSLKWTILTTYLVILPFGFCTISVFAQFWHPAYARAPPKNSSLGRPCPLAPTASMPLGLHYMMQYCTFTIQYCIDIIIHIGIIALLLSLQLVN